MAADLAVTRRRAYTRFDRESRRRCLHGLCCIAACTALGATLAAFAAGWHVATVWLTQPPDAAEGVNALLSSNSTMLGAKWECYFRATYATSAAAPFPFVPAHRFWVLNESTLDTCSISYVRDTDLLYNQFVEPWRGALRHWHLGPSATCLKQGGRARNSWYTMGMGWGDRSSFVWHGERFALSDHQWIEVSHVGTAPASLNNYELERDVMWTYYMPGTNFWLFTGKLLVLHGHNELLARYSVSGRSLHEDATALRRAFASARRDGYDAIQFVFHSDQGCGNSWMEVVFLHESGNEVCAAANARTGIAAERVCKCIDVANTARCS